MRLSHLLLESQEPPVGSVFHALPLHREDGSRFEISFEILEGGYCQGLQWNSKRVPVYCVLAKQDALGDSLTPEPFGILAFPIEEGIGSREMIDTSHLWQTEIYYDEPLNMIKSDFRTLIAGNNTVRLTGRYDVKQVR